MRILLKGRALWLGLFLLLSQVTTMLAINTHESSKLQPNAKTHWDIWNGTTQSFGANGRPQRQINILGDVSDGDGLVSLAYKLNGGSWHSLSWKADATVSSPTGLTPSGMTNGVPDIYRVDGSVADSTSVEITGPTTDNPRLVSTGDFNIEIDFEDLSNGSNEVIIRSQDSNGTYSRKIVYVNFSAGNRWPLPYTIDWSQVTDVTDVVQIVDGEWKVSGNALQPVKTGYDRLVAMGDNFWDDFEVLVPITIDSFPKSNTGGAGILARWAGHFVVGSEQPGTGWWDLGAYGYWRNRSSSNGGPHLALRTGKQDLVADYSLDIPLGVPYYYKMRVQTKAAGLSGFYSFKVWPVSEPEPTAWNLEVQDALPEQRFTGSVLLVAHEAKVRFGNVTILPVLDVDVSATEGGSVDVSPLLSGTSDVYLYGDELTLEATPNPGWIFTGWSGDLSDDTNPLTLTLTDDLNVTANFSRSYTLDVSTSGNGSVEVDPPGPIYSDGTTISLTATADLGWTFDSWSGNLTGQTNPETLLIDGNKNVLATFSRDRYTLDVSKIGNGTVTVTPLQSTYTYGEQVTLEATADPGWTFDGWSGDLSGKNSPQILTITKNSSVTTRFDEEAYKLTIADAEHGTVLVEPDQETYTYGQQLTLTAVAERGWEFIRWGGDIDETNNPTTFVISGNVNITPYFEASYFESFIPFVIAAGNP